MDLTLNKDKIAKQFKLQTLDEILVYYLGSTGQVLTCSGFSFLIGKMGIILLRIIICEML